VSDLKDATRFEAIHLAVKGEPLYRRAAVMSSAVASVKPPVVDSAVTDAAKGSGMERSATTVHIPLPARPREFASRRQAGFADNVWRRPEAIP